MLVHLPNAFGYAAGNMALDAALLTALPSGWGAFRHYGWAGPTLTFGYAQRYRDVRSVAPEGVALCRRPTGGGIVDHRDDWTYALVLQADLAAARIPAPRFYGRLHWALCEALHEQAIPARLADQSAAHPPPEQAQRQDRADSSTRNPSQCFVHPAENDVVRPDGRKIAGAAMKRTRDGLLIQGSVDRASLAERFDYGTLAEAFVARIADTFAVTPGHPEDMRPLFPGDRIEQERRRFADPAWLKRR